MLVHVHANRLHVLVKDFAIVHRAFFLLLAAAKRKRNTEQGEAIFSQVEHTAKI